mgnify:CR=1 FL=1
MFKEQIKRFIRDESGAFLVLFGVMAIVLVATSGAVVDYVTVEQARNRAQVALDSAVLALQPEIAEVENAADEEALRVKAENFLIEQIANDRITASIDDIDIDPTDGTLFLEASIDVPLSFVALVGITHIDAKVVSKATQKKLRVEVAMVLDNSGSMGDYGRMDALKLAAKSATNILFEGEDQSDKVAVGIVPFTLLVNVGNGFAGASWIDQAGVAPISNDNFDDDEDDSTPFTGNVDRLALYDSLVNESWKGCVEAREYPYNTTDDTPPNALTSYPEDPAGPVLATEEAKKLFTPQFAPDEPDSGGYSNSYLNDDPASCQVAATRQCEYARTYTGCSYDGDTTCYGSSWTDYTTATYPDSSTDSNCSCSGETITSDNSSWYYYYGWRRYRVRTCTDNYMMSTASGLSSRELQERLCKYDGNDPGWRGPNTECPNIAIQPLHNDRSDLDDMIDSMSAGGGTNIHMGTVWGYRVLSPTEPFTEGYAYDTATYKVMIIMTDGKNTFYDRSNINGTEYYSSYSFLWNGRIESAATSALDNSNDEEDVMDVMDELMVETCANAKNDNIDIFTIGLEPPSDDDNGNGISDMVEMLTACATDPSQAYFPENTSELGTVFEEIANQLAELRLSL